MRQPHNRRGGGFVITVEAILIFTIVILALLVALAALRNALVDSGLFLRPLLIFDSTTPDPMLVGKVFDFDDTETPRVLRRDPEAGLAVLLGVRALRFATRDPVFYSAADCAGDPYVKGAGFLGPPAPATAAIEERVGFFDRLQGAVYAVGAPTAASLGGELYRGDSFSDPCAPIAACPAVASVYFSSWEYADALAPDAPPPSASSPSALNPCRDLADPGPRLGLVPALEVVDPATSANVLAPFVPPFAAR